MATATNTSAVNFPNVVPQSVIDASRSITHITGWDASTGGNDLITIDITDVSLSELGQTIRIPASMITLTQPEIAYNSSGTEVGRISADMAERLIRGAIEGGIWWLAHYGDPGTNRTANSLTELGRAEIGESDWTVAQ